MLVIFFFYSKKNQLVFEEESPHSTLFSTYRSIDEFSALVLYDIASNLRDIHARFERQDHHLQLQEEWRAVALVVDRFVFWVSTVVCITGTIVMLSRKDEHFE